MINPVMMHGIVQRSQDISPMKQGENLKPAVEQANIQVRQEKDLNQKMEQVTKKDETNNPEKKFDAKDKGSNQYEYFGGNKKKKEQEEESDGKVIIKQNIRFDARI